MTEIGAVNAELSFAVEKEGIVDRVEEKHEEFMEELEDERDKDMWDYEVLRTHREREVLVEYPFWSHHIHVRFNPYERDTVFVQVYQNVPMKYFHKNWEDFAEEILEIDSTESIEIDREYLQKVKKAVETLEDSM